MDTTVKRPMTSVAEGLIQLVLAVAYTAAAVKMWRASKSGPDYVRLLRLFAVAVMGLWIMFYSSAAFAAITGYSVVTLENQADFARSIQFGNVALFLVWAKLADTSPKRRTFPRWVQHGTD